MEKYLGNHKGQAKLCLLQKWCVGCCPVFSCNLNNSNDGSSWTGFVSTKTLFFVEFSVYLHIYPL